MLRLGKTRDVGTMHRAIWAPGVRTKSEAVSYLNREIASRLSPLPPDSRVLDMGCGVGGVAVWLARRLPHRLCGVTLSSRQADEARLRAAEVCLSDRVKVEVGDFEHLGPVGLFDAAYAVESFVHASSAEAFFRVSSRLLRRGGYLVVADDFLSRRGSRSASRTALQRFRRGWHVRTLVTAHAATAHALRCGFQCAADKDLTEYVAVPPAALLYTPLAATWLPLSLPYWQSLRGGSALQLCYSRRLTEYHLLTFVKQ